MDKSFVMSKQRFEDFIEVLKRFGPVYAPVRVSDQSFEHKEISGAQEIALEALRTITPPKKFFFAQHETLLTFDDDSFKEQRPEAKQQVVFGLHACDLAGIGFMDKIFSADPGDPHYLSRREATLLVGLSCLPDKHCFCKSMECDSPYGPPAAPYDLFLTDIGDGFFLQVANARAYAAVEGALDFMVPATSEHVDGWKEFWRRREDAFVSGFDGTNLRAVMDMERDNPVWERLGKRCLSCGNCTFVCPTCYCFDVFDIRTLHADSGERVREWDSCQLNGFALVADGTNYRPTMVDRYKFWYRHKLHGFEDPAGVKGCVGCGRCTVSCPADIDDIVAVVVELQASAEKRKETDAEKDKRDD